MRKRKSSVMGDELGRHDELELWSENEAAARSHVVEGLRFNQDDITCIGQSLVNLDLISMNFIL